jgi:hypothetical protein
MLMKGVGKYSKDILHNIDRREVLTHKKYVNIRGISSLALRLLSGSNFKKLRQTRF